MEPLSPNLDDTQDTDCSELSEMELDDLISTKFVQEFNNMTIDDDRIETVRAAASPLQFVNSPIIHEEFMPLADHPSITHHEQHQISYDKAEHMKNRILNASEAELKVVDNWKTVCNPSQSKYTSRASEMALIETLFTGSRPTLFQFDFHHLKESDISSIIQKSLVGCNPPKKYRSLVRIVAETNMTLKNLIGQLEKIGKSNLQLELLDMRILASTQKSDGTIVQKFLSNDILKLAELEYYISHNHVANTATRFSFGVIDKPFVTVNVTMYNNFDFRGNKKKNVTIEQQLVPINRSTKHVTFGDPNFYEVIEFEIADGTPFHPLSLSSKFIDLISYLEKEQQDRISFEHVTTR